jgi:hypothetical protein
MLTRDRTGPADSRRPGAVGKTCGDGSHPRKLGSQFCYETLVLGLVRSCCAPGPARDLGSARFCDSGWEFSCLQFLCFHRYIISMLAAQRRLYCALVPVSKLGQSPGSGRPDVSASGLDVGPGGDVADVRRIRGFHRLASLAGRGLAIDAVGPTFRTSRWYFPRISEGCPQR